MVAGSGQNDPALAEIPPENGDRWKGVSGFLNRTSRVNFFLYLLLILLFLILSSLYLFNLSRWSRWPNFGWTYSHGVGGVTFASVYGQAAASGLRAGDRIVRVNGREIGSYFHLQQVLKREEGDHNTYTVERGGQILTVSVPNRVLGLKDALYHFGLTWILGICFFLLGVVVFYMKPGTLPSWAFLIMMFCSGLLITYFFTSKLVPGSLNYVIMFAYCFLPASMSQLTVTFPEERRFFVDNRLVFWAPYVISTVLFISMVLSARHFQDLPNILRKATILFLSYSLVLFLLSIGLALVRPSSDIARIRSQVLLVGTGIAVVFPVLDAISAIFLNVLLVPHPVLLLPFFFFFPLSIAYSIARHNLFDVNVYIKRAVGYVIMTVLVGSIYFSIQVGVKAAFAHSGVGLYSETVYPVIFAILVVFFFNPVNSRVQGMVDRLFYREKFDYKDTVISVSNALTSVLNMDEIVRRIIETVRREMFIDTAGVVLLRPENSECEALFIDDEPHGDGDTEREECLAADDPIVSIAAREKKLITKYDIAEDGRYADVREIAGRRFNETGTTLVLPMRYREDVTGLLALGNKKSGQFYTREDIDLLETLCNQGAVAIENARLAEQMKQEETVRTNLARYLSPQIVEQVIHEDVDVHLGGNRKVVTVLFSDIRDFTVITEARPADQLIAILNEYFTEMARIIFDHQGSLDKYIGDAIVAVFGSLIEVENPTENAVRSAVEMMNAMPLLNERWQRTYDGFHMEQGIGINTGEVFLGNIGSPERMEFTVIGDTVNVASRFSGLAGPGEIFLTERAAAGLGPAVPVRELPPSEVKGKSGEMRVYRVQGIGE
jgi:class 3 adenylate cyclase